jgi:hypothetical protein
MPDFHPQAWMKIVEALSVYDQWLEGVHDRGKLLLELQLFIHQDHSIWSLGGFVRQGCE